MLPYGNHNKQISWLGSTQSVLLGATINNSGSTTPSSSCALYCLICPHPPMRCIQARSALFWLLPAAIQCCSYSSAELRVDGVDYYYKQKHTCAFNRFSYLLTNKRLIGVEVSCRRSRGQSRLWGWREVKPYTNNSSKSNNQYHPIK